MGLLSTLFKPTKHKREKAEESIVQNQNLLTAISPDSIKEKETYVRTGSNYTRTLLVVNYDPVQDQRKVQQISEMSENISIVNYIKEYSIGEVKDNLIKSIKQNRMKKNNRFADDETEIEADAQIDSAKEMLKSLTYSSDKIYLFHTLIHLVAKDLNELDQLTLRVKSRFESIGVIHNPTDRAIDAFNSFLPLNYNYVKELTYKMMNSEAVGYFFPFHENEMFDEKGDIKGKNISTGNVVIVDDTKLLNRHEFVIGISGSGKTTYLLINMLNKYMLGRKVIAIDPKGDFGRIFEDMGGTWVKFQLKGGKRVNPFDLPSISDEDMEDVEMGSVLLTKISHLLTMFRLIYPSMNDLQEDILSRYIQRLYEEKAGITDTTDTTRLESEDFPVLEDLYDLIEDDKEENPTVYEKMLEFHTTLEAYVFGMYSDLLNGPTNANIDSDLVNYDLKALQNQDKIQRILFYNILSHTTNQVMEDREQETNVFIDEAHIIADPKVPLAMNYVHYMMKVLRSFNTGIITASQSIKDFLSARDEYRNYGEAVITQSIQRLYLPMAEEELKYLEEELGNTFSKQERSVLILKEGSQDEQAGKGIFYTGSKKIKLEVQMNDLVYHLWKEKKSIHDYV
ncbi:VirB4 family type IV secretion system protein [Halobacillus amylolyticus]|uniref:DUF87 domain-containing protein n=1 Tax=Halobacillus amylolyticus TaxID=2932259 RepID=A0ABY4HI46_9BACI|nr:DUF87 domain-containing protein [Halobacillus amylolyticus]UOR14083.1 DUF87 domain-containing protein [Halobacillus amylolyticus]